jgi:multiple sugar transport system substrate-binding protein
MSSSRSGDVSRREFLRLTAAAAAAGPLLLHPERASASGAAGASNAANASRVAGAPGAASEGGAAGARQPVLRIAKYAHFLPEYDVWFENVLAKEWGRRNGVTVLVDHVPVEEIAALAAAEAAARRGHDLFMFPWPPAEYRELAIDHAEVYTAVSFRQGSIDRLAHKSTFDPARKRYFAFADSYMPTPLHYFEDQWNAVGMRLGPNHYNGLLSGGQRLRAKLGVPCGLALTPTLEGNITLYTLLLGFGGSILDAAGNVFINKGLRTVTALKYVKTLVEEAGSPEQLAWGPGGSVRAMLARKSSCAINGISLLRAVEKEDPEVAAKIRLCPPLLGRGYIAAVPHVTNCSMVWSFAENLAAAKRFLSDLPDSSKAIYEQTQGCNFPMFQKTLPDLIVRLENDPHGQPPYKYKELKDALHWTGNLGYPGYADPVTMETLNTFVLPRMFLAVVKGEASPEEAARAAEVEIQRIADKWKQT